MTEKEILNFAEEQASTGRFSYLFKKPPAAKSKKKQDEAA